LVTIGTGTGVSAVTTGTAALNVNAAAVLNALMIQGNDGANILTGTGWADVIFGGAGNDQIAGGAGADRLYGGLGNDTLSGGEGQDAFVFNTTPNATTNKDTITDFVSGADKIELSKTIFAALDMVGGLSTDAFFASASATKGNDASDRIVYNTTTGALYYDADGSGATAAIQIALLGSLTHPLVTFSDFEVVV
jgi:Ca2+-binding RTX toxin-like protein